MNVRSIDVIRNLEDDTFVNESTHSSPHEAAQVQERTSPTFIFTLLGSCTIALLGYPRIGIAVCVGMLVYHVVVSITKSNKKAFDERAIDHELPIIAEKLLMAVRSGYDLVPAISLVGVSAMERDVVARKFGSFAKRCEDGERLETILKDEAMKTNSIPLKHLCLHLGVAYREGGELSKPLEELSDATQHFIEERENEEIAKLPVKATAPLILIFFGLIITFVTPLLLQIITSLSEVKG